MEKKWFLIAIGVMAFSATLVSGSIPDAIAFIIENSTQTVFTVDKLGYVNATGNIETDLDLYVGGDVICTDCISDADVSNTLTASDLVAGSSVVADSEVDNSITIEGGTINLTSNTYSGTLGWGNLTGYDLDEAWTGKLGYNNLTACSDTQILKMSGSSWACASDAVGSGGEDAYVNETGDTMTGDLKMTDNANISLNGTTSTGSVIKSNNTNAYFYFDADGGLVVHLEA